MAKKKKSKTAVQEALETDAVPVKPGPIQKKAGVGTWPVPRSVVVNPELSERYVKPGHLAFINGFDRRYQPQSLAWTGLHPDLTRPYYDEEEAKTALPQSWPPNFNILAPEQQHGGVAVNPVQGGWTWPGQAAPKLPTLQGLIDSLPGPLRRFFS